MAEGFNEFTADRPWEEAQPKRLFTRPGERLFCIAGIWRAHSEVGEAFTMLTLPLGPDVGPYHDRQIAILDRTDRCDWSNPAVPAQSMLKPLPAGSLAVEQVG